MKTLTRQLERYLLHRRGFGYNMEFTERVLRKFTEYANTKDQDRVTTELFLEWQANYGSADSNTWSRRLGMVRGFATWLQQMDGMSEIPPEGLVTGRTIRPKPYIYSAEEIVTIVTEAGRLSSPYGFRGLLWQTVFGLIAATGIRISEALRLDQADIELQCGSLAIRRSKNGQDRSLPIQPSVIERLSFYAAKRRQLIGASSHAFFVNEDGRRPGDCSARYNFAHVCQNIGLRSTQVHYKHGHGPRIHDLRHTFAVNTILGWFREGLNVDDQMFTLSSYLGHSSPENTYWYIEAVPELMQLAAERSEHRNREDRT
jgi:integrase/recombinase XerD